VNFQANARKIKKNTNEDHPATERDANKVRRASEYYAASYRDSSRARRASECYAASEPDPNRARRANEDYAATERYANKGRMKKNSTPTRAIRPQNEMLIKFAIKHASLIAS
jgi:hypothetical protein